MKIVIRIFSVIFAFLLIFFYFDTKLTLYEAIYLVLVLINIVVIIEISYFFVKKMSLEEKKDKFIFKQLDVLSLELQKKELVYLEEKDYPKYLLLQKKIDCLLTNIAKIINEKQKEKIEEIQKDFNCYKEISSENIQKFELFNSKTTEYKKIIQKIENSIIELQTQFFQ